MSFYFDGEGYQARQGHGQKNTLDARVQGGAQVNRVVDGAMVPKGYRDMVPVSMRFPDLTLGPYKRDLITKPFGVETSSAERLLHHGFEHPAPSTVCLQCSGPLGSHSGGPLTMLGNPCILVSNGRVLPVLFPSCSRSSFRLLGRHTPFEF